MGSEARRGEKAARKQVKRSVEIASALAWLQLA